MKYKIFSFFSGSGFLDLGFENAGYEVVYVNEIHEPFLNVYKYSREKLNLQSPIYGYHNVDIENVLRGEDNFNLTNAVETLKEQQNIVGFIGGPPCPDFSVGGKNKGKDGENGILTKTYIDLICKEKPSFFLFENVKGLWKTKKHREFYDDMKEKLHSNGYVTTERLINSLEYGVPQQRERIILIGFQRDLLEDVGYKLDSNIHEISVNNFPWNKHTKYKLEDLETMPFPTTNEFKEDEKTIIPEGIPQELTVEYWFEKNDVYNHSNANQFFQPRAGLPKFKIIEEGDDCKKSYKRLHRWRYSPTAAYGNNEVHLHPYKARRLSVSEALAIQSMPKEFALPIDITLSNAFKTIGNGVPYLASLGIAKTIQDFLEVRNESINSSKFGKGDSTVTEEQKV